jgi:FlaA1/EpsC-like NDP-sugar epimerase
MFDEQDRKSRTKGPTRRVLIAGAGETGTLLAREMQRHPESRLMPVGYLDDEQAKQGRSFVGIPVLGTLNDLRKIAKEYSISEVLIAMPSAPGTSIRELVTLARDAGVNYRIFPGLYEILSEKVSISQIREVNLEDLLRRDPVRLSMEHIAGYLEDRVVLVTGAAGTIGSEIVHQVTRFSPRKIILIDRNENSLYLQEIALKAQYPYLDFICFIADIQRPEKLERIFARYHPEVVFHAAAHKHVPFMDLNPDEAILNNVCGTRIVLEMAQRHHVKRFVNISTDKAVEPTSVMGATKRIAEHLVAQAAARSTPDQSFVSVRFGNVLGSNGSVVPIFKDQIKRGGPVTVTHPEMTRYFMSVPEAVQLVLQAGSLGDNGAIYILDMGNPVKIVDLAHDLIRLSGFEPDEDIMVKFTGKRPGEKLFEELRYAEEEVENSTHEKIYVVHPHHLPDRFSENLEALIAAACVSNPALIQTHLKLLIPSYKHIEGVDFGY